LDVIPILISNLFALVTRALLCFPPDYYLFWKL
jgi:hypothetical protein